MDDDYGTMIAMLAPAAHDAGWEGDDATVTCPCGHDLEPDAPKCPDGCTNPLIALGVI